VAARTLFHLGDRELRDVVEARHVHIHHGVVFGGVFGERLSDVDAGIVHQRIDPAKSCDAFGNDSLGGRGITDVTGDAEDVSSSDSLIDREVATMR
jgi:hypothetical protein